jgi:hypothetical protein
MADLEEQCFVGDHEIYTLMLTVPQLILYVLGLPLLGLFTIIRNRRNFGPRAAAAANMDNEGELYAAGDNFRMRFGLLYLGYRPGREWWEGNNNTKEKHRSKRASLQKETHF